MGSMQWRVYLPLRCSMLALCFSAASADQLVPTSSFRPARSDQSSCIHENGDCTARAAGLVLPSPATPACIPLLAGRRGTAVVSSRCQLPGAMARVHVC